jgi:glycosyltransferase involved in cell wall biosynthesis
LKYQAADRPKGGGGVLHLIPHLVKGGAERQLIYLASHWARSGHDVHIAYLSGTPIPEGLSEAGVILHPVLHIGNNDPMILARLIRLIRRIKPSIVQTWLLQMDVLGGCAALITNTPWVLREPVSALHWRPGLKVFLRKWLGAKADAIVSNSTGGDAYWKDVIPSSQRFIIRNTVPVSEIQSTSNPAKMDRGQLICQPLIVSAGRLDEQKNFETVIRALAKIIGDLGAHVVIFGEGPLRKRLEDVIQQCGMAGKIHLPGTVPNIWGALKSARLFVSMSRYEGNPNVVLEAMASECPIVLSDIPAHREVLDDETAFFVEQYEDQDLVASALVAAWQNSGAALTKSRLARNRLDASHDISNVCKKYEAVYQAVMVRREVIGSDGA